MFAGLFHYEARENNLCKESFYRWHDIVRCFRGDRFLWVDLDGQGDQPSADGGLHQCGYPTLTEAVADNQDLEPVYLVPKGGTPLSEFKHPLDALYIVGPDGASMTVPDGAKTVTIPVRGELWANQALAIVVADRMRG